MIYTQSVKVRQDLIIAEIVYFNLKQILWLIAFLAITKNWLGGY